MAAGKTTKKKTASKPKQPSGMDLAIADRRQTARYLKAVKRGIRQKINALGEITQMSNQEFVAWLHYHQLLRAPKFAHVERTNAQLRQIHCPAPRAQGFTFPEDLKARMLGFIMEQKEAGKAITVNAKILEEKKEELEKRLDEGLDDLSPTEGHRSGGSEVDQQLRRGDGLQGVEGGGG
jgi:hypothetical protein